MTSFRPGHRPPQVTMAARTPRRPEVHAGPGASAHQPGGRGRGGRGEEGRHGRKKAGTRAGSALKGALRFKGQSLTPRSVLPGSSARERKVGAGLNNAALLGWFPCCTLALVVTPGLVLLLFLASSPRYLLSLPSLSAVTSIAAAFPERCIHQWCSHQPLVVHQAGRTSGAAPFPSGAFMSH